MADFSSAVKKYGSVSAALKHTGYTKTSSGGWRKTTSSSNSSNSSSSKPSSSSNNTDYYGQALEAAKSGNADAAYAALSAREQKMNSSGYQGTGGGTSMSDAYKTIQGILGGGGSGGAPQQVKPSTDYYANALSAAQAGDAEAAYKALAERANKMNSPDYKGSGGGTTMEQAYANIASILKSIPQQPQTQVPVAPPQLTGLPLGDRYGLTYDRDQILDILNRATEAEYDAKFKEFGTTENKYINQAQTNQAVTLDSLLKANQQSTMTGASQGVQSATALSSILAGQQANAENMLDIANQRNLLSTKKEAALSSNASKALSDSNAIRQAIAGIDLSKYGYDTQQMVGQLDYLAALNDALTQIESTKVNAEATKYASDNDLAANKYNSDSYHKNTGGTQYVSRPSGAGSTPSTATGTEGAKAQGAETGTGVEATNTPKKIAGAPGLSYQTTDDGTTTIKGKNGEVLNVPKDDTIGAKERLAIIEREGDLHAAADPNDYTYDKLVKKLFSDADHSINNAGKMWDTLKAAGPKKMDKVSIKLGNGVTYTYNNNTASWYCDISKQNISTNNLLNVLNRETIPGSRLIVAK